MVWENIAIYNRTQLHETCFGILGFSVGLPRIRLLICLLLFSWAQDNLLSRIRILTCITLFWPTPLVHAHIFFQCKQDHKFRTYGSQRMLKKKEKESYYSVLLSSHEENNRIELLTRPVRPCPASSITAAWSTHCQEHVLQYQQSLPNAWTSKLLEICV